jgi:hypothetical protein
MEISHLIQRLQKPYEPIKDTDNPLIKALKANPFAFGGGYKNGGFDEKSYELINQVFRFDYMGSAEFEFGAVPKAMQFILENKKQYISKSFNVSWKYQSWYKEEPEISGKSPVYVICKPDDLDEIKIRIKTWANGCNKHLKEITLMCPSLASKAEIKGWIDIDNKFFFFIDKEMFEQTVQLFDITVKEK